MAAFLVTKRDGANMMLSLADGGAVEVFPAAGTPGAGTVLDVTATAPSLVATPGAPGAPAYNIAAQSPSRAYGRGGAVTLGASQTVADATIVPSNTGKLQISVWGIVANAGETNATFTVGITDSLGHTLFVATTAITVAPASASAFSMTIDSDLPTGAPATPETYALGVPVTINLVMAQIAGVVGAQTIADGSSGILVKENFV